MRASAAEYASTWRYDLRADDAPQEIVQHVALRRDRRVGRREVAEARPQSAAIDEHARAAARFGERGIAPGRPRVDRTGCERKHRVGRRQEAERHGVGRQARCIERLQRDEMADRAARGADALALQVGRAFQRRIGLHEHRRAVRVGAVRADHLDACARREREDHRRVADRAAVDGGRVQRFCERRGGRELGPRDVVRRPFSSPAASSSARSPPFWSPARSSGRVPD